MKKPLNKKKHSAVDSLLKKTNKNLIVSHCSLTSCVAGDGRDFQSVILSSYLKEERSDGASDFSQENEEISGSLCS